MGKIKPWILAARPKTLGAAIAPVLVGTALGYRVSGEFCIWLMLATLGACICLQVAVNFFNDAVDGLKGSDTKERLGPMRITASGMMPPHTVLRMGVAVLVVAALLSIPLVWMRGWPILAIGIPSLYFCYGYTGGPWPLAYRGLGELFVVLFFGLIAVSGSAYVQSGLWSPEAIVAGLQVGMLSTVLIAINNLRDVEEDTKTGKRTLAVRLGPGFARLEIMLLLVGTVLLSVYWLQREPSCAYMAPIIVVVIGVLIMLDIQAPPSAALNRTLAKAGAALLIYSIVFSLCLALGKGGWWSAPLAGLQEVVK